MNLRDQYRMVLRITIILFSSNLEDLRNKESFWDTVFEYFTHE